MSDHTPGPWRVNDNPMAMSEYCILSESRGTGFGASVAIANQREGYNALSLEEAKANARRIVACINACEGSSTEWLEFQTDPDKVDQFGSEPFETRYSNALRAGVKAQDMSKQLLDTLKDAHPYINNAALRLRIGGVIATSEGIVK